MKKKRIALPSEIETLMLYGASGAQISRKTKLPRRVVDARIADVMRRWAAEQRRDLNFATLTDEQLKYIAENNGRLPPEVAKVAQLQRLYRQLRQVRELPGKKDLEKRIAQLEGEVAASA